MKSGDIFVRTSVTGDLDIKYLESDGSYDYLLFESGFVAGTLNKYYDLSKLNVLI